MGCTARLNTSDCFNNRWVMCRGVYWGRAGGGTSSSKICMSRTGGSCPGGERKTIRLSYTETFGDGEYTVKLLNLGSSYSTIEVWRTSELAGPDNGFGFGKAEITQTSIGHEHIFNVGASIEFSLRVWNTGDSGKIYGVIGLGYHDKDGNVYLTGRYANEQAQVPAGETITWNGTIEVLHKDYAAREMTSRGPAVYFMSGHDENGKVVWDRSEYIPVELILESGYVDPLDPEGPPDDWPEPIPDKPETPGTKTWMELLREFWDSLGIGKITLKKPRIIPGVI